MEKQSLKPELLNDILQETEELIQIFADTPYQRNREILIGYYGWADGRSHTLTEIGTRFGITRERIRQICAKLTKRRKDLSDVPAPVTERVLALIERRPTKDRPRTTDRNADRSAASQA